jgi:hypothetical protein
MRTCLVFLLVALALVIAGAALEIFGNSRTNAQLVGTEVRTVTPAPTQTPTSTPTITPTPTLTPTSTSTALPGSAAAPAAPSSPAPGDQSVATAPAAASTQPAAPQGTPVITAPG